MFVGDTVYNDRQSFLAKKGGVNGVRLNTFQCWFILQDFGLKPFKGKDFDLSREL